MNLRKCILTENDCYRAGRTIKPKGVMVHSTGANNPNLRRYVQPDDGLLGRNTAGNHWNRPGVKKCVHAFVGLDKDGNVASYETLPWNWRGWHCGDAANNTHIAFEICEDGLEDGDYFRRVYREAVELTAYLCRLYGLDPMEPGVVIDHKEGHDLGIASGHGDVGHWFPRHGKTMDDFRRDVEKELKGGEDDMTQEQFDAMMDDYLRPCYAHISFTLLRNTTICSRVQKLLYCLLPCSSPRMMPFSSAHSLACALQSSGLCFLV